MYGYYQLSSSSNPDFLVHYGIKGQQWGVRRFQNEDGTLTEEGKARYLDRMTDRQRKMYFRLTDDRQRLLSKKLGEGKSWAQATIEMNRELKRNAAILTASSVAGLAAIYAYSFSPRIHNLVNSNARRLVQTIQNTSTYQRGAQYMERQIRRNAAKKNGAIVLNKNNYWIHAL